MTTEQKLREALELAIEWISDECDNPFESDTIKICKAALSLPNDEGWKGQSEQEGKVWTDSDMETAYYTNPQYDIFSDWLTNYKKSKQ